MVVFCSVPALVFPGPRINMLQTLAILLLCVSFSISHSEAGNLPSMAQVDLMVLEDVISDVLAKGDLLQRFLGDLLRGGGRRRTLLGGLIGGQEEGGLLAGLLGSEGLLGLEMVDIILPKISLKLLPGVGLGLDIYTRMTLKGSTFPGGLLNLRMEANITGEIRLVQEKTGAPRFLTTSCKAGLSSIWILSGFLPLRLDYALTNLLKSLIPGLLCPVVDLVLNVLNTVFATVNNVCPFGMLGNLHYTLAGLPLFSGQHIILNLNLMVTDHEGKPIGFPGPQPPSLPLPPAEAYTSRLLLPRRLLSSLLQMLAAKGGFSADIAVQALRGTLAMGPSAVPPVLPGWTWLVGEDLPLVLRVRIRDVPEVDLQNGTAALLFTAALEVLLDTNSTLSRLLRADMTLHLSGIIAVTRKKLGLSLSLQRVSLRVSASQIGSFDEKALEHWITNVLRMRYLPLINGALNIGIPLPNIFNLDFADGIVTTFQETLVISKTPLFL